MCSHLDIVLALYLLFDRNSKIMSSSSKHKKVFLILDQRVAAIKMLESGKSAQSIADEFGCGRTQIQVI